MLQNYSGPDQPAIGCVRTDPFKTGKLLSPGILMLILMALVLSVPAAVHAGDEDISPSMYQTFDPVTGFAVDVEQPPDDQLAASQQNHAATQPTPDQAATTSVAPTADNTAAIPKLSTPFNPVLVASGIFLLILIATIAFKRRKTQHTSR